MALDVNGRYTVQLAHAGDSRGVLSRGAGARRSPFAVCYQRWFYGQIQMA